MTDTMAARKELLRRRREGPATTPAEAAIEAGAQQVPPDAVCPAERRMWRIHQLDPGSVAHNITLHLECRGIDAEQLVDGIGALLAGAPVFASVIAPDWDDPRRIPVTPSGRWLEPGTRWSLGVDPALGADGSAPAPAGVAERLARTPFDLTREIPLRAWVDGSTLVLCVHHLAVDDGSWPLLLGSILAGRRTGEPVDAAGRAPAGAGAPGEERIRRAVAHARRTWAAEGIRFPLTGAPPTTTPEESWLAPVDEAPGGQLRRDLDPEAIAAFTAVARDLGGTGNAALVVLCALAVTAVTGATDHVLAVPVANRHPAQTPDRVGYCGNIVPVRFTFDPAADLDRAMRDGLARLYSAMEYSDVDFGAMLTALRNSGGRFPVLEIMASVRPAPLRDVELPAGTDVDCRSVTTGVAGYPLTVAVEVDGARGAHLEVDYQDGTGEHVAGRVASVVADLLHRLQTSADLPLASLIEPGRDLPLPDSEASHD